MELHCVRLPIGKKPHKTPLLHIRSRRRLRQQRYANPGHCELMVDRGVGHRDAWFHPHLLQVRPTPQTPYRRIRRFTRSSAVRQDAALLAQIGR